MGKAYFALVAIALLIGTIGGRPPIPASRTATKPVVAAQVGTFRLELRFSV